MDATNMSKIRVLMFPWLAYSHIQSFLELAKKLSKRNFYIYLCSTPANLAHIKVKEPSIQLVELLLPSTPELPPHHHTTKGLPRHLLSNLMKALDFSSCSFSEILTRLKPDLLISDFLQPWAPAKALTLNIPTVQFMVSGAMPYCHLLNILKKSGTALPLRSNYIHERVYDSDSLTLGDRPLLCLEGSSNVMLIRSFRELEGKYIDELSVQAMKKIVLVGPLVQDPSEEENEKTEIIEWLNKKNPSSVLFVSFGSECYLSKEDKEELAHGILLSNVSFIWVLRFPQGEKISAEEALPEGITGEKGLIIEGWAPQKRILSHPSIGGFLSHCGWASIMESMKFGVPIVAMPMHVDQPSNAKLLEEVGIGLKIKREPSGKIEREEVAKVVREAMLEEPGGPVRRKSRELSDGMKDKGDEDIGEVVKELVKLCGLEANGYV
ncbi:unnamed protein product [Dovyalis caffra]|uniref:Glycosyltransferase n=1 Tax=Dovyalis caffra TaxID=77055 RepID=A0AAV1QXE7_9ROSI|nr:unnamed protein product [Dovyalis caffra]